MRPSHSYELSCTLNSTCDCMRTLRYMVEAMSSRAGLGAVQSNRILVAVDELFANIREHGYHGGEGLIEMRAELRDNRLRFEFRDYAQPIADCDELKGRDVADVQPRGIGLRLIRAIMDEIHHTPMRNGNHWILIKHIPEGDECDT